MDNLLFSINAVAPVFLVVFAGRIMARLGFMDDTFVTKANAIVFNLAMPVLVFLKISAADFSLIFDANVLLMVCGLTFLAFMVAWIIAVIFIKEATKQGPFIQGTFRSNTAIIGLALAINLFSDNGVTLVVILLAFLMPLYNILSVFALTIPLKKENNLTPVHIFIQVVTNPLIIAILLAIPFSLLGISIEGVIHRTLSYVAQMTLPVALLCIGATLDYSRMKHTFITALGASVTKIIVLPVLAVIISVQMGLRGETLGAVFLVFACPTAISSFIMAKAMDNDGDLAAQIVLLTTTFSMFTIAGGIFLMKLYGLL